MKRIYLDHAATTPIAREANDAMLPWLAENFGNPSSLHAEGRRAKGAIDEAREVVSTALGCLFAEVVFTSSGTEAANLAVLGTALANRDDRRNRILLGAAEHHSVLHTRPLLERFGYCVELVPVDAQAGTSLDSLENLLDDDVLLVSIMHANNEIGTINPILAIADRVHRAGALLHIDAVQTFLAPLPDEECERSDSKARTWRSALLSRLGADLVSVSAHKVNGPMGVGALYQRAGVKLRPIAVGGGQEREVRAGTENVPGIVGFAAAVQARQALPEAATEGQHAARDLFLKRLSESGFIPTAPDLRRVLGGHAHVRLPGVDAETMLIRLDRLGISASSGAACSSGSLEPSHVLLACGYSEHEAREGLRFTFAPNARIDEAGTAAERVIEAATGILGKRAAETRGDHAE